MGTSDSGKTTFSRQVRVLHGQPFSETEMKNFKKIVRALCLEELSNILVHYIATQNVTPDMAAKSIDFINKIRRSLVDRALIDCAIAIWKDMRINFDYFHSLMNLKFVQDIICDNKIIVESNNGTENRHVSSNSSSHLLYQSDDPGYYLLPKFVEIMSPGYEPTLIDILSIRVRTTGKYITIHYFFLKSIQLINVTY